jgi:hypothetical protein
LYLQEEDTMPYRQSSFPAEGSVGSPFFATSSEGSMGSSFFVTSSIAAPNFQTPCVTFSPIQPLLQLPQSVNMAPNNLIPTPLPQSQVNVTPTTTTTHGKPKSMGMNKHSPRRTQKPKRTIEPAPLPHIPTSALPTLPDNIAVTTNHILQPLSSTCNVNAVQQSGPSSIPSLVATPSSQPISPSTNVKDTQTPFWRVIIPNGAAKDGRGALWIGNEAAASDLNWLKQVGVTHMVNCALELPNHFELSPELTYSKVPMADYLTANPYEYFDDVVADMAISIGLGRAVFVYCSNGLSRALSFAFAYLLLREDCDLTLCQVHLRTQDALPKLSYAQKSALKQLEKRLNRHPKNVVSKTTSRWKQDAPRKDVRCIRKTKIPIRTIHGSYGLFSVQREDIRNALTVPQESQLLRRNLAKANLVRLRVEENSRSWLVCRQDEQSNVIKALEHFNKEPINKFPSVKASQGTEDGQESCEKAFFASFEEFGSPGSLNRPYSH